MTVMFSTLNCQGIKVNGVEVFNDYCSEAYSSNVYEKNTRNIIRLRRWTFFVRIAMMRNYTRVLVKFHETEVF